MNNLSPVGYVRGGGSGVSQIEHFDDVRPYMTTVRDFVSWLAGEQDIDLVSHPMSSIHPGMPPLHMLLDEYFEIDVEKLRQERRALQVMGSSMKPFCKNCGKEFTVDADEVWLPDIEKKLPAPMHYFGGLVCSEACDALLCLATLANMSDFDQLTHIQKGLEQVERNWE